MHNHALGLLLCRIIADDTCFLHLNQRDDQIIRIGFTSHLVSECICHAWAACCSLVQMPCLYQEVSRVVHNALVYLRVCLYIKLTLVLTKAIDLLTENTSYVSLLTATLACKQYLCMRSGRKRHVG